MLLTDHYQMRVKIIASALTIGLALMACSSKAKAPDEHSQAYDFWNKYLVQCGDSYYVEQYSQPIGVILYQFKERPDAKLYSTQRDYTDADKLNGQVPYDYLGRSELDIQGAYRQGVCSTCSPTGSLVGTSWQEWKQKGYQQHVNVALVNDKGQWGFYSGEFFYQQRGEQFHPHNFVELNCSQLVNQ